VTNDPAATDVASTSAPPCGSSLYNASDVNGPRHVNTGHASTSPTFSIDVTASTSLLDNRNGKIGKNPDAVADAVNVTTRIPGRQLACRTIRTDSAHHQITARRVKHHRQITDPLPAIDLGVTVHKHRQHHLTDTMRHRPQHPTRRVSELIDRPTDRGHHPTRRARQHPVRAGDQRQLYPGRVNDR
jgi:hypothetical protein